MLQLVSEQTKLMTTRLGVQSTVIYDPERIHERYGLHPGQMIDFKALKGDSTDNIPGIPGVGDKTAAKLLVDFGSLEGVFARIDEVKPDKLRDKLKEHREDVLLWRELVTIDRLAPIALDLRGARLGDYDRAEVIRLFREYEFRSLVERLPGVAGRGRAGAGRAAPRGRPPRARAGRRRPRPGPQARGGCRRGGGQRAAADARLRRRAAGRRVQRSAGPAWLRGRRRGPRPGSSAGAVPAMAALEPLARLRARAGRPGARRGRFVGR